jgi:hypothetical protein
MIVRDLRYAAGTYLATPVFSGIAALVLAIAIGAGTVVACRIP